MFTTARQKAAEENMVSEGGQIARDAEGTASQTKEAVHRLKNDARAAASSMKEDLEDVARRTGRHVRDLADQATDGVADAAGTVTATIRDNPVQSSLIALGVGITLGLLWRR